MITSNADGSAHLAPLGLIVEPCGYVIAPFAPSHTLENLRARPYFTANVPSDVRVFAGCITGRRNWLVSPAKKIPGHYLAGAHTYRELKVVSVTEDAVRPRFHCHVVHEATLRAAPGFNRAQAAVIEAAILASRLAFLDEKKIRAELVYLQIAVDKTAGPEELEAWGWLQEKIEAHFSNGK
ncbi:MAG: DUF447 family protein [Alphaproteobacteria bacterium]